MLTRPNNSVQLCADRVIPEKAGHPEPPFCTITSGTITGDSKMRTCKSCQQIKPLSKFQLRADSGTYRYICLLCEKEYKRIWRLQPHRIQKDRVRRRGNNGIEQKIRMRKYCKEHREQYNRYLRKYRAKRTKSELARRKFRDALRRGKIEKETECQECGSKISSQSHHPDYGKPLAVEWLCLVCHGKRHWKPEPSKL